MRRLSVVLIFMSMSAPIPSSCAGNEEYHYSDEVQVKSSDTTGWEFNQDLCVNSKGNLYMARENKSLMAGKPWHRPLPVRGQRARLLP